MRVAPTPLNAQAQEVAARVCSTDEFTWRKALIELAILEGNLPVEKVTEANICMSPWQGRGRQ